MVCTQFPFWTTWDIIIIMIIMHHTFIPILHIFSNESLIHQLYVWWTGGMRDMNHVTYDGVWEWLCQRDSPSLNSKSNSANFSLTSAGKLLITSTKDDPLLFISFVMMAAAVVDADDDMDVGEDNEACCLLLCLSDWFMSKRSVEQPFWTFGPPVLHDVCR